MQWSKLKKRVESLLSPKILARFELRCTSYRKAHDQEGRGYFTIDKEEVWSFCTQVKLTESAKARWEAREQASKADTSDREEEWEVFSSNYLNAIEELEREGIYSHYQYHDALEEYLSTSIDDALESENIIIKGLAILDKRVGKRRLSKLQPSYSKQPLLKRLFELRCEVENITKSCSGPSLRSSH